MTLYPVHVCKVYEYYKQGNKKYKMKKTSKYRRKKDCTQNRRVCRNHKQGRPTIQAKRSDKVSV